MPKVSSPPPDKKSRRKQPLMVEVGNGREPVRVSSVLFGLALLAALIVAAAAWMGGSLNLVERRLANTMDRSARGLGLAVEQVAIVGVDGDLARVVRESVMVEEGENMFRADPHLIRKRIESTRRVVNVRVHRLWPNQIIIIADPAEPIALLQEGADWSVIDELGQPILGQAPETHPDLLKVKGAGAGDAAPALARALIEAPNLAARVGWAERIGSRRWDLVFDTGLIARLPTGEDVDLQIQRLTALHGGRHVADLPADVLDLRVSGRVFLRPSAGVES